MGNVFFFVVLLCLLCYLFTEVICVCSVWPLGFMGSGGDTVETDLSPDGYGFDETKQLTEKTIIFNYF